MDSIIKADRALALVQQVSGLAFSSFTVLHLGGHLLSIVSFSWADSALFASRVFYQNPIVEPLVIGVSLLTHIGSSALRVAIRYRRQANLKASRKTVPEKAEQADAGASVAYPATSLTVKELRYHRLTGYLLSVFIGGHVLATRITPLKVFMDPTIVDLTFITQTLNGQVKWLYFPYFAAFGTAGIYHTAYGVQQVLGSLRVVRRRMKPGVWTGILVASSIAMTTALVAMSGAFEHIPIPLASKWKQLDDAVLQVALGRI
ncbi:hypothetical protein HKX48_001400 [Thoreauomyces humboldtii]|nr:hypothetical protein HKX48_001400 [Thoreauomyces humboldtii]